MAKQRTASLLIIGNEILSGRTQDKNLNYIANRLKKIGVKFSEARVVPDIHDEIATAVNALREKYDYVFTTGGIGPTHDDITTESVAKAFGVKVIRSPEAQKMLEQHYAKREHELNDSRLRMADVPEGAELIPNPLTSAPGYKKDNVFVMAGIPSIMQVMFDSAVEYLETGSVIHSKTISCDLVEGDIAEELGVIQQKFDETEIGSYPFIHQGEFAVSVVVRGFEEEILNAVIKEVESMIRSKGGNKIEAP